MFPLYGFGGKLPGLNSVSHCFALNGDIFNPEVSTVEGILGCYANSLRHAQLYGGTHFSGILRYVNGFAHKLGAENSQYNQKYSICLILTDGVINDMDDTIDELVTGSQYPLSVIIVGVGNADFD